MSDTTYNKQKIATKQIGKVSQTTVQVSRRDKHQMTPAEVAEICDSLFEQANGRKQKIKMMIRALTVDKWWTLKSFDNDLDFGQIDEYLDGMVHDSEKFNDFSQIHITIYK